MVGYISRATTNILHRRHINIYMRASSVHPTFKWICSSACQIKQKIGILVPT
jgi:hypothetical protein